MGKQGPLSHSGEGGGQKGKGQKIIETSSEGGDLLIFHLEFIPSENPIYFMFINHTLPSTIEAPKHPEGNLMFFMI